jgi:hypothetical protein
VAERVGWVRHEPHPIFVFILKIMKQWSAELHFFKDLFSFEENK